MRDPEVLPADVGVLARPPRTGGATFIGDDAQLRVPASVTDLESFCEWVETDDVPEKGNIWWLRGEVWADMSKEQLFTHVDLKGAIFAVLYFLVKQNRLGRIFTDGARLTNPTADLSGKPDAMFLSEETLDSDRALLMEGAEAGYVEVVGIPDMVLEVVSTSSVKKDLVVLLDDYWLAPAGP